MCFFIIQVTINLKLRLVLPFCMTKIFMKLRYVTNSLFAIINIELGGIRTTLRFATNSLFVTIYQFINKWQFGLRFATNSLFVTIQKTKGMLDP